MKNPKITVFQQKGNIKCFINDILHFSIKENKIIGIQSWIAKEDLYVYNLEIYTKDKTIKFGYNSLYKWSVILKQLNSLL